MSAPSILIVACDAYLAGIFGRKFELDGWEVEIAESLEEGERKASKLRPQIFLLDVDCVVDTAKEIQRLRSLPTLLKTKLVMLAGAADRTHIQAAKNAGADTYLLLGHFVPQEAVAKMKKLLET